MNYVEEYAVGLLSNARKYLKLCLYKCREKELHEFRVDIKKVDALLHFLSYIYGDIFQENKKLKKLFSRAGKIRNLQLMIHHLERQIKIKGEDRKNLMKKLKQQLTSHYEQFIHRYKNHLDEPFKKSARSILRRLQERPEKERLLYFSMMNKKINLAIRLLPKNEKQLHKLRKDIKRLKYNLKLSDNTESVNLMNEKLLDKWDKLLGEWHDTVLLAHRVDEIITKMKPESDLRNELESIRNVYRNKSKTLLKKLILKEYGVNNITFHSLEK